MNIRKAAPTDSMTLAVLASRMWEHDPTELEPEFAELTASPEAACFLAFDDDKAVGFALKNRIDLRECLIYYSGRMPIDMASKAIRAGVPILASKGAPTAGAVELARKHDLTLICAARRDRMKQFAGPAPK